MKFPEIKKDDEFPLWMFGDSNVNFITRGRTQEEAYFHICRNFERGQTITLYNYNLITSAEMYLQNHSPGWLHRPMVWLQKLFMEKVE